MKPFGKIAICLAGGIALSAGSRADDLAMNNSSQDYYTPIIARNVFGLNPPPPPVDTSAAAAGSAKIAPSGIQNFFGQVEVLFKVTGGKKDQFYMLAEGQRQDDIEVVRIDEKDGIITFNNHGVTQDIPLVATASGSGGASMGNVPSGFNQNDNGGNNFNGGQNVIHFSGRGGGFNHNGMNNGNNGTGAANGNNDSPMGNSSRTYQPPSSNLTPEEQIIQIEKNRAAALDNNDPTAALYPPTPLTKAVTGQ